MTAPGGSRAEDRFGQASDWFALMRGPEADTARQDFEMWRNDPDNDEAYREIEAIWDAAARVDRVGTRQRPQQLRPGLIAASLAAAVTIGLLVHGFGNDSAGQAPHDYANGHTDVRLVALDDGSRITLDAQSRVRTQFGAGERRVTLLAGRARFSVAHDSARPFVVTAASHDVIARGTVFDVRLAGDMTEVTLIEGAVDLERRRAWGANVVVGRLAAGQSAVFVGDKARPRIVPARGDSWTNDMIVGERISLARLLSRANRSSSPAIVLADPTLGALHVTGGFALSDSRGLARGLAAALDLTITHAADGRIVLAKRDLNYMPAPGRVEVGPTPEPAGSMLLQAMP